MTDRGLTTIVRFLRADVVPTAVAGVVIVFGSNRAALDSQPGVRPLDAFAYLLLALSVAAIPLRNRAPFAMLAVESLIVDSYLVVGYPHGPNVLALSIAAYAVGLRHPVGRASAFIGKAAALFAVASVIGGDRILGTSGGLLIDALGVAATLALVGVPGLIGHLVRQSKIYAGRAEDEATRRKLEQERLRVAREVHDVVGHSLSIISLQAGVALHVLDRRPEQAQLALDAIRRTSIDALEELRATLALTRAVAEPPGEAQQGMAGPTAGAGRVPLTGLARLAGLVAEVRLCNVPVELTVTGSARALPPDIDLAAYRIVQESITNVLRHAGLTQVQVTIDYQRSRLGIDVVDRPTDDRPTDDGRPTYDVRPIGEGDRDAPPSGSPGPGSPGHGLVGLKARVAELAGTFSAGPAASGGWRVHAELPLRNPSNERGRVDQPVASPTLPTLPTVAT